MIRLLFITIITMFVWNVKKEVACANNCEQGFVQHGSSCYHFSHDTETWLDAQEMCEKLFDASLAEIESTDENSFIYNQSVSLNANFWLGGDDLQTEGEWRWLSSQKPLALSTWCTGNPSNSALDENCLEMNNDCHGWNDDSCSKFQKYVCEKHAGNIGVIG